MSVVMTDDQATVDQMKFMSKQLGAELLIEMLPNGFFRLTMSDEDRAKLKLLADYEE